MIEVTATTRRKIPISRRAMAQIMQEHRARAMEDGSFVLMPMDEAPVTVRRVGMNWRFSVDTQFHGPGLHLAFYSLLERLSEELKTTYRMDDPSQYAKDMEPRRLTEFYQQELADIARQLSARPVNTRMQVHWALPEYELQEGAGIAGPISRWGRSHFLARSRQDMEGLAEDFYIAPHAALDGVYHRNLALFWLQNEITYLRPEVEAHLAEEVCVHLEQASRLHPSLPLPLEEYERCARLANRPVLGLPNPPLTWGLIGYRREPLRQNMGLFSWVHPGHFDAHPDQNPDWMFLGDRQFHCHWALVSYSADRDPHQDYPFLQDAPLFKGLAAPELAQDDASFGLKCSRRLGERQLLVLISFEAPYSWQDVYDFLNSVAPCE